MREIVKERENNLCSFYLFFDGMSDPTQYVNIYQIKPHEENIVYYKINAKDENVICMLLLNH